MDEAGFMEVGAAHNVGDALCRIVEHHRQMVGVDAIPAFQHDITCRARQLSLMLSEIAILETYPCWLLNAQTQAVTGEAELPVTADSRINESQRALRQMLFFQLASAA